MKSQYWAEMKILMIGYGNPGRQDDGLGPALAERFQTLENVDATSPSRSAYAKKRDGARAVMPAKASTVGAVVGRMPFLTIESNYQLNVEDAVQIAEHDVVIFADASTEAEPPFTFEPVEPEAGGLSFSSHSVSAPQLMGMVKELFHAEPQAYMLAIRGYDFNEFGEGLSAEADNNLDEAVCFLKQWLSMTNGEIPNDGRNDEA